MTCSVWSKVLSGFVAWMVCNVSVCCRCKNQLVLLSSLGEQLCWIYNLVLSVQLQIIITRSQSFPLWRTSVLYMVTMRPHSGAWAYSPGSSGCWTQRIPWSQKGEPWLANDVRLCLLTSQWITRKGERMGTSTGALLLKVFWDLCVCWDSLQMLLGIWPPKC